ncbi:hypothetical protein RHMOL_Rhmol05G0153700 [Rhododendron molle]|uniref:Uncharacterized protein n=1 Tax=Rhododendron molle TaxID=49168 RepID=A0ACC0NQA1_RHOML|nr:hypothetical protein RHMOL_Rhmol05G0153700 [Rhododendron molle]
MTAQLVEDPYFPYTFPYLHDFYQKHGAIPHPKNKEEDGDEAVSVLVQIAPPDDAEFIIKEVGEEPEGNLEKEPMEEEDPEEWEIEPVGEIEPVQEPEVMDILFNSGDVPPPPYETDIGV